MFKNYTDIGTHADINESLSQKTKELLRSYQDAGLNAEVLYTPVHENAEYMRNKKVHDIKGALRTLKMATDSLQEGYRFDDAVAELKITAMQKAVAALNAEITPIITLISSK